MSAGNVFEVEGSAVGLDGWGRLVLRHLQFSKIAQSEAYDGTADSGNGGGIAGIPGGIKRTHAKLKLPRQRVTVSGLVLGGAGIISLRQSLGKGACHSQEHKGQAEE